MPSRAIPNGQTVTLRLDADLVLSLKVNALRSRVGLSELIGSMLKTAIHGGAEVPPATRQPPQKKPAPVKAQPQPKPPAAAPKTKKAPGTKPKGKQGTGDADLFKRADAAIKAGKIGQRELMVEAAPEINPANYRSSWTVTKRVPAKYVEAVKTVLDRVEAHWEALPADLERERKAFKKAHPEQA